MIIWILLGSFFVLLIIGYGALRKAGGGNFPWLHFYAKGKESGFTFKEVNLLRKVAVENRLKNPTALFWSIGQLDRSIKGMILNSVLKTVSGMKKTSISYLNYLTFVKTS